jgi:hypothetical protein
LNADSKDSDGFVVLGDRGLVHLSCVVSKPQRHTIVARDLVRGVGPVSERARQAIEQRQTIPLLVERAPGMFVFAGASRGAVVRNPATGADEYTLQVPVLLPSGLLDNVSPQLLNAR